MNHLKKTILSFAVALTCCNVQAAGFQLNGQSVSGLGRAFAGDGVIADNASAMARNVAVMSLFSDTQLSIGVIVIDTDVSLKDAEFTYLTPQGYNTVAMDNVEDISGMNAAPNFFIVHPIDEQLTVGFGMYSNFATTTEYDDDFIADIFGGTTKVRSVNMEANVSYRVDEQWSIGAGLDVVYGAGELYREFKAFGADSSKPALDVEGDGFALGWHIGAIYQLNADHRFGLSYRYAPTLKVTGDFTLQGQSYDDDTLILPLPSMTEFSGYHQLTAATAIHYSVQYIEWKNFDVLKTDKGGVFKTYQWQNAWHLALGTTHQIDQQWTVRAGYMYDKGAVDKLLSITIPDSDRQWFSAGFTYQIDSLASIDFGLTYLMGQDVKVTEQQHAGRLKLAEVTGTTRANATLMGFEYNLKF